MAGLRVIAGTARGHHLKGGGERGLRATSDLVRGAMFDILQSMNADLSLCSTSMPEPEPWASKH